MGQRAFFLALGLLAPVLAGCGAGTAGHSTGPCRPGTLALGYGPAVSPMTEEHADWYKLTNRGPSACRLDGVSKQAAQKRFVPRSLAAEVPAPFSRFTPRAANVLAAAGQLAGTAPVGSAHLAAGLLTEPDGIAARVVSRAGLTPGQFTAAVGTGPAPVVPHADPAGLEALDFGDDAEETLKGSLRAALGLGHNYIGTEHILLGVLGVAGPVSAGLAGAGLDAETAGRLIAAELTAARERRGKA
jgi:hypothetical protein